MSMAKKYGVKVEGKMFNRIFDWYLDETKALFEKNEDEEGLKLVKEAIVRKIKLLEHEQLLAKVKANNDAIASEIRNKLEESYALGYFPYFERR